MELNVAKEYNSPDCMRCFKCTVSYCHKDLIKSKFTWNREHTES